MIYNGIETNNDIKKKIKSISAETEISISDICQKLNIMPQSYQNIFKKQNRPYLDDSFHWLYVVCRCVSDTIPV